MSLLWQIGLLLGACLAGQVLALLLPLPASVLAMLLVLLFLCMGLFKHHHLDKVEHFLMQNMAFFFVPACVNVFSYLDVIGKNFVAIFVISIVSTVVTFVVTALTVRGLRKLVRKERAKK